MFAAVEDVELGHRQWTRFPTNHSSQVAIEWHAFALSCGTGHGQGDAQDGVGAQMALVGRAVSLDQRTVKPLLVLGVPSERHLRQWTLDVGNGRQHTLAAVPLDVAVAQLDSLAATG